MAENETDQGELDNWFAEPGPLQEEGALGWGEQGAEVELDDWLRGPEPSAPRRTKTVGKRRIAAAAILGVCLLIGLAVGGVFSDGSEPVSAPPAPLVTTAGVTASASTPFTPPTLLLPPASTLKRGARGPGVTALQRALARLGYYSGRIDGQYGSGTESAVSLFQTASSLTPDGIFGRLTRRALRRALGR